MSQRLSLKSFFTSLAFLLILTVATRAAFAAVESRKIPSDQLVRAVFQTEAGSIARSLAQSKGFSSPYERESGPTAILPPVYPLLTAAVFRIFGIQSAATFYVLVALNIAFAALTCIPIYRIGLRLGGPPAAVLATYLWALFPNGVFIPFEWIWETSLSALLAATLLWFTLDLADANSSRNSLHRWILYGLLWGLTLMTNPALGAALPFLLFWTAWPRASSTNTARNSTLYPRVACALAITILCCLPWTIRNFAAFHHFIPLRSGFAFELYIGNNENYSTPYVWPPRVSYERELLRYLRLGETSFMDEEKRKAYDFIRANPALFAELSARRFIEFWIGSPDPLASWQTHPAFLERLLLLTNLLLPLTALAGVIKLLAKRHSFAFPLLTFPAFYPLVYYITHASLRYRHPIDPILFLLTSALFFSANLRAL